MLTIGAFMRDIIRLSWGVRSIWNKICRRLAASAPLGAPGCLVLGQPKFGRAALVVDDVLLGFGAVVPRGVLRPGRRGHDGRGMALGNGCVEWWQPPTYISFA